VIQLVVAPLSDACASRWGRRHPFILWGIVGNLAATISFAVAGNFPLLMVSFFGIQLFLNIANGPYQALLPDTVEPERHGIASAYMGGALLLGQLFGALALLAYSLGFVSLTGVLGGILVLLCIGAIVTWKQVPDSPAPLAERLPFAKAMATLTDLRVKENPDFFQLLASRFFVNLSYSTVVAFLLYYLQDTIQLGEAGAGKFQPIIILTATVAGLIGTLLAGSALKTLSKKQVVYFSSAVIGLAALIFAFTSSQLMVLVLAFLFGGGWGAFQAVDWALAVNLLPKGGAARYMAVWHVCMTVPQIIAPLFGRVADSLNKSYGLGFGWRAAMFSTVIYLIIGTLLLRKVTERPEVAQER
jgi:Na+/melibiose symporter-like transporter